MSENHNREQWQLIVDAIHNGCKTGVNPDLTCTVSFPNHTSAQLDLTFISSYIAEEQATGRCLAAFTPDKLEATIRPFCSSPLGLVPKPNSDKMRLIEDLSYPRNNVRAFFLSVAISSSCILICYL